NNINIWFDNFETKLKELFEQKELKLQFDDKGFNFKITYGNKSFGLNELSDGYSSLLAIVTELILRMEAKSNKSYDMQGVVLIDEIETHLHVELQKKVLPFLVGFFPKIQFIVTTHSPFVLSSLSNAVICDLEKRMVTSDLSAYSYDALVESYFDSDKYSSEIKKKIERFENLAQLPVLSDVEKDEYMRLKQFFKTLPTYKADELSVKIKEILRNDVHKG
ncbi:MAG: AAA family ATPase, partial [Sulfurimonas sp.]|nr:AAA family ATPase [Sulfurimonas sp.]